MAKSKNAALFEVMTKSRQQPRPGFMGWLGGLFDARRGTPVLTVPKSPSAAGTAQPASAEQMAAVAADGSGAAIPPIAGQGVRRTMLVDSDQGLIYLQLTFTSAAIIVVAVLTVVAMAFMVGKSSVSRPAIAQRTDDELRQQPPQPSVMDLSHLRKGAGSEAGGGVGAGVVEGGAGATSGPTEHVVKDRNRTIGLNYVIIQSYPTEQMAAEAMNLLVQNDVECTVEKTPADYGRVTWFSVVGVEGFSRIRGSAAFDAYIKKIKDISEKSANKKSFKAFEPAAYKWKKQE